MKNTNNTAEVLLVIIIMANPWMLSAALSNIWAVIIWIICIYIVFAIIKWSVSLLLYDTQDDGTLAKSSTKSYWSKLLLFFAFISGVSFLLSNKNFELGFAFILFLSLGSFLSYLESGKSPHKVNLNNTTKKENFSIVRFLKLLTITLVPFCIMIWFIS